MTTDKGSDGSKASFVINETSERFSSSRCAPTSPFVHFKIILVVGTVSTLPAYVLKAYLPGSSGVFQTPRLPWLTISPCLYSSPDRSALISPVYDTTTPTVPTSTVVLGIISTVANSRLI